MPDALRSWSGSQEGCRPLSAGDLGDSTPRHPLHFLSRLLHPSGLLHSPGTPDCACVPHPSTHPPPRCPQFCSPLFASPSQHMWWPPPWGTPISHKYVIMKHGVGRSLGDQEVQRRLSQGRRRWGRAIRDQSALFTTGGAPGLVGGLGAGVGGGGSPWSLEGTLGRPRAWPPLQPPTLPSPPWVHSFGNRDLGRQGLPRGSWGLGQGCREQPLGPAPASGQHDFHDTS